MGFNDELPKQGEVVVIRVSKVLNYGAFAELVEFENLSGFIPISQVASSWIKNIRNHVKENQVRAAKVLGVNREKQQIDLSLTRVSTQMEKERIESWKQFKRTKKLIEVLAKKKKKDFDTAWDEIAEPLIEEYGSLVDAFKQISKQGNEAAKGVSKTWVTDLVEIVKENMPVPEKTIHGLLTLKSSSPQGVEDIKKSLKNSLKKEKDFSVDIYYVGSGSFMVKITSFDYKVAEKALKQLTDSAIEEIQNIGGEGSFARSA